MVAALATWLPSDIRVFPAAVQGNKRKTFSQRFPAVMNSACVCVSWVRQDKTREGTHVQSLFDSITKKKKRYSMGFPSIPPSNTPSPPSATHQVSLLRLAKSTYYTPLLWLQLAATGITADYTSINYFYSNIIISIGRYRSCKLHHTHTQTAINYFCLNRRLRPRDPSNTEV